MLTGRASANRSSLLHWSHVTCHTSHVTRHTSHVTRHMSHVTISHVTSPHVPCCSVPFRPQDFPLLRVLLIDLTTSITVAPARRCHSRGQRKSASQRHAHPCLHAMEHQNLAEAIQLMEKIMAKLLLR